MSTIGIKSASAVVTATLVATPCTLLGAYWRATGTGGTIVLDDGGTTVATINTPAAVSAGYVRFEDSKGNGIVCTTDLGVTMTNADGVTAVFK